MIKSYLCNNNYFCMDSLNLCKVQQQDKNLSILHITTAKLNKLAVKDLQQNKISLYYFNYKFLKSTNYK